MAYTGPVESPLAFNTIFEVDDLIKFLTKTEMDLNTRFDVINGLIKCVEPDEDGFLKFDNIRKMLENVVTLCEDIALSMGSFSHALVKKKMIKRNTSLPHICLRRDPGTKKRDSGIESEKVSSNWSFTSENSENRLSVFDEEDESNLTKDRKVSFELMTPSQSTDDLEQQVEGDGTSLPNDKSETPRMNEEKTSLPITKNSLVTGNNSDSASVHRKENILSDYCIPCNKSMQVKKDMISTVYIHLIPTDSSTDLSVIQDELLKFSNSMIPRNVRLELVTSDIIIGLTSRHVSSSSDSQTFIRNGLKASDEPLSVRAFNNLSRFAVENSESSDDDNRSIRLISSSDSETSIKQYYLKPVIEKKSVETQTDDDQDTVGLVGSISVLSN